MTATRSLGGSVVVADDDGEDADAGKEPDLNPDDDDQEDNDETESPLREKNEEGQPDDGYGFRVCCVSFGQ